MLPQFLQSLANNESYANSFTNYSLETIGSILNLLGNPQEKIPCIHVAGTNGKGSTAYMVAKILQSAGYIVGLYTSPHLMRYNERITINEKEITDYEIFEYSELVETLCKTYNLVPTLFDAFTIIAFLHFHNSVDVAVIETGLGGRLDSTNVITPLVSVITPISYDHMAILGSTLQEIAYQKAGIIKHTIPIVSAKQNPKVKKVLQKEASTKQSPLYFVDEHIHYTIQSQNPLIFDIVFNHLSSGSYKKFEHVHCSLTGDFQAENASVAIASALILKNNNWAIVPEHIFHALSSVYIPGRSELLCDKPVCLFDCAHNPEALYYTLQNIHNKYSDYNTIFCISFMKDKDITTMLRILHEFTSKPIFYLQLPDSRCYIPDEEMKNNFLLHVFSDIRSLSHAIKTHIDSNDMIFFTGTFRLYPYCKHICSVLQ